MREKILKRTCPATRSGVVLIVPFDGEEAAIMFGDICEQLNDYFAGISLHRDEPFMVCAAVDVLADALEEATKKFRVIASK